MAADIAAFDWGATSLGPIDQWPISLREPIGLLLTDVVMPGMNGRELADLAMKKRPSLKGAGYTRSAVLDNGVIGPGTHFLAKLFRIDQLSQKVRDSLDASDEA